MPNAHSPDVRDFSNNNLTALPFFAFGGLSSLQQLYDLNRRTQLSRRHFMNNRITLLSDHVFDGLTNLQDL